ncbi:T9SS type A sorting domain-containing protein [Winogradskyella maritima]|uniref:ELWxxDGT repeat protein n=1 Tax=Winogradskyella maritima TaxID=1517766 RepID=A0ABV8AL63_9FLAO|nr:T9SS type A sorting domain-containing protein [Winogradskyella maritima]
MIKNLLYFSLFAVSLSQAQVNLVKDINPGVADGIPIYGNNVINQISFNNILLFAGRDDVNGIELWKTDGTSSGTILVKNISQLGDSEPQGFYKWELTGNVYFSASNSTNPGLNFELWETDGTPSGTNTYGFELNDSGSSSPMNFATIDGVSGRLLFSADYERGNANNGIEICFADASSTTSLLGQLNGENNGVDDDSSPKDFTLFNNMLYFTADNNLPSGNYGRELFQTNTLSSGTTRLTDINPNGGDSNPEHLTVFNNRLYFTAFSPTLGNEIFRITTNGSVTNLKNINPGNADSNADELIVYNNQLFFTADDGNNGKELWSSTGFGSTTNMLININPNGNSSPDNLTIFNNKLYFGADDGTNGVELWVTDGTSSGTVMLKDINPSGESTPQGFIEYFGELYFNADDGVNGRELWKTDGTSAGTVLVEDIETGVFGSDPLNFVVAGNQLFFSASTTATGRELFRYIDASLSNEEFELSNSVLIYPNPTKHSFSIDSKFNVEDAKLYDVQGKLVKILDISFETFNVTDIKSGIYFVKLKMENGLSHTEKLIIDN